MTINDVRDITSFKWATVVTVSPLSIKLDGDTAPLAMIPDSLVDPFLLAPGSRVRVELSLRKAVIHGVSQGRFQGTTAERDARFGVPANDAQRVALANQQIRWFNTDYGWEEQYFAVNGTFGLTAPDKVMTDAKAAWYPLGPGPALTMRPVATFSASTGNYVGNWNGVVIRKGGNEFFGGDGLGPKIKLPGIYDINVYTVQSAGSGLADYHIRLNDDAAGTIKWQSNLSGIQLSSSYFTWIGARFQDQFIMADAGSGEGIRLAWFASNATLALHNTSGPAGSGRGELAVRYMRPPLVTD